MARWLTRFFDLREGEARPVVQSFLVLFLLIGAHTTLETARDALFLTKLPPKELNLVYIALAGLSFVAAALSTRLALRFGRRNALIGTLGIAAVATVLLHNMAPTPRVVMALYVFSGLVGAVLSPQFWLLAAQMFTSSQGRRLFGPVASGGVFGGVAGATTAAVLLARHPVTSLLLVAAFAFIATALLLTTLALPGDDDDLSTRIDLDDKAPAPVPSLALSQQPFVWRVALLVGLSTAAVLTVDYLFKSTAASSIAPAQLGEFFARYYAVMNGVSLVVQLLVAGRIVRRLGVAGATGVMPSLLLAGGVASFVTGGALLPVLAMRMVDGGLRHSLNRVATELLYLPMPTKVRERAKGLIDTVLSRSVQAVTAAVLFGLGTRASPRVLAGIVLVLCVTWAAVAAGLRRPYLDLFRRALSRGTLELGTENIEIDVNAAEALVEAMASPEPVVVVAALDVLQQRNRGKLIPALILYHDAEPVLFRALDIFGASPREDWVPLGERLLSHSSEGIRIAAVRALAKHGVASALAKTTEDPSTTVRAYAALHLALADLDQDPADDLAQQPRLASMLEERSESGDAKRRVLLTAIADAADSRATSLVLAIARSRTFAHSELNMTLLARAMKALHDPRYIPFCVALLATRPAREAIRQALVAMGDEALVALEAATIDEHTERRVRTHLPRTIADFQTQRACDFLMTRLQDEPDGFVRYKVLRGLGHIVASSDVKVDRRQIDNEARKSLVEHLRITALRVALDPGTVEQGSGAISPTEQLLLDLLTDKQSQALERAFRLLKIAHRREDIHRVHSAAKSKDRRARSNAGEFLDTLLAGPRQRELRELFRLVVDDLEPIVRVRRAAPWLGSYPHDRKAALVALAEDRDVGLANLSRYRLDVPLEAVAP
jgi:AAA family ATP:ADP antiporter